MLGLLGLMIAIFSSKQRKMSMQDRHLCWPPWLFLRPAVATTFVNLESPLDF